LQLVWAALPVPLEVVDWRSLDEAQQRERLEAYLREDRVRGFDPQDAPQWRMLLARVADDRHELVWSAHHTILDGWSLGIVLRDVTEWYGALTSGRSLERTPARPYRDYVSWLQEQDLEQAEQYWRDTLHGIDGAVPLSIERYTPAAASGAAGHAETDVFFGAEETAQLHALAAANRLTLNTLLQGCWALLLGRYTEADDIVFGTVVSGRPADVTGVEGTVGLFINTLPLRVQLPADSTVVDWLQALQQQNLSMRHYEYSPLSKVRQWSGLPAGVPLFDSLFVFENYPVEKEAGALRIALTRSEERVNYAIGLVASVPEDRLRITVQYDTARFERDAVERMIGHLRGICGQIAESPQMRLSGITVLTEEERRQVLQQSEQAPIADDFDLSAYAAAISDDAERALLEQLVAEVRSLSQSDLQDRIPTASPATETSDDHE
ncbi:condensation domain-containing protein, partial [Streptomyces sp. NPDC005494]|uniref:condensation domain-containing protein n=1 Tax=Streptomyces sp. NPDC005494 TaxID=3364715 RepID=UPI0036BDA011